MKLTPSEEEKLRRRVPEEAARAIARRRLEKVPTEEREALWKILEKPLAQVGLNDPLAGSDASVPERKPPGLHDYMPVWQPLVLPDRIPVGLDGGEATVMRQPLVLPEVKPAPYALEFASPTRLPLDLLYVKPTPCTLQLASPEEPMLVRAAEIFPVSRYGDTPLTPGEEEMLQMLTTDEAERATLRRHLKTMSPEKRESFFRSMNPALARTPKPSSEAISLLQSAESDLSEAATLDPASAHIRENLNIVRGLLSEVGNVTYQSSCVANAPSAHSRFKLKETLKKLFGFLASGLYECWPYISFILLGSGVWWLKVIGGCLFVLWILILFGPAIMIWFDEIFNNTRRY
jgi:hypothetical protein